MEICKKEIKTIKSRTFTLKLSDSDIEKLFLKTGKSGITPEELLENFIGDLLDGTYSNGSDERMYANQWFDRCFCMNENKSFLKYLLNEYGDYAIKEIYELTKDLHTNKEELKYCSEEAVILIEKDIAECEKELKEYEKYYEEYAKLNSECKSFDEEIALIVEWYENMNKSMNE